MEKSTEIWNELQSLSPLLASREKVNPFGVPDGYFSGLEQQILTSVLLHEGKREHADIPEGYFDTLSDKILSRVKNEKMDGGEEESASLSPLLLSLRQVNVFTVPEHYFESLAGTITAGLYRNKAKVIPLGTGKSWWKYAAAAVIAAIVTITSLQVFDHTSSRSGHPGTMTASAGIPEDVKLSYQYKTPELLKEGIASLNDDDIVNYLEKTGSIIDDEQLVNGTDTREMPNPDDYLIDENALNNYLKQIDDRSAIQNTQ